MFLTVVFVIPFMLLAKPLCFRNTEGDFEDEEEEEAMDMMMDEPEMMAMMGEERQKQMKSIDQ